MKSRHRRTRHQQTRITSRTTAKPVQPAITSEDLCRVLAELQSDGLIYETGYYRDGVPVLAATPEGARVAEMLDAADDAHDDAENVARVRAFAAEFPELCGDLRPALSELVYYVVGAFKELHGDQRNDATIRLTKRAIAQRATALMRPGVLRPAGEPELEVSDEGFNFVMERLEAAGYVEIGQLT